MPRQKVWGYEVRDPYPSELGFFQKNPKVSGMAAEDGRIILNPYSGLTPDQLQAVARNEAARLYLREKKYKFDFDLTPEQQEAFKGTPYASDPESLKASILSRGLSGDLSSGILSQRQKQWVDWLLPQLEKRGQW